MNLVLSGPPGCGKGTQAELLVARTGLAHYSTGDVFREQVRRHTAIGEQVQAYLAAGQLVPDAIVLEIVTQFLTADDRQLERGVLFDGFPRTIPQAQGLDQVLARLGRALDYALFIELAEDIIVARLTSRRTCRQCGAIFNLEFKPPRVAGKCDVCGGELYQRADDTEATIRNRLAVFERETSGLKDYYRQQGKLFVLDGALGKDRLHQEIMTLLGEPCR